MQILSVTLSDFRNVKNETADISDGVCAVVGDNAQGKTNLIEAVYLLSSAKSFRVSKYREMIMHTADKAVVKAEIKGEGMPFELKFVLDRKEGKSIYRNGCKIEKLSRFLGTFRTVLFCPEHLSLIKEGPKGRRSFIDGALCQIRPYFASLLNEFLKTEAQRSALIRAVRDEGASSEYLSVWNEKLAQVSAKICFLRSGYINELKKYAPEEYFNISGGKETLKLHYQSDIFEDGITESEMYEKYLKILSDGFEQDKKYGFTHKGPHRDDLLVFIDSHPAKSFSSQGQQRSAVLALKSAEGEISLAQTGNSPVYLLDDVLSELDENRARYITENRLGRQMIITGTDENAFSFADKKIYVSKGKFFEKRIS